MNRVVLSLLGLGFIATAVLIGSLLSSFDVYPVANFSRKVFKYVNSTKKESESIETILIGLDISRVQQIKKSRSPQGGDLATFRNELVLINNDGVIFSDTGAGFEEISLKSPGNGFEEYRKEVLERKSIGKLHNPLNLHRLRYNGILHSTVAGVDYLIVSFVYWNSVGKCVSNRVSVLQVPLEFKSLRDLPEKMDWRKLYDSRPCLPIHPDEADIHGHVSGGKIANYRKGSIVIANSDFEWDGVTLNPKVYVNDGTPLSQDPNSEYGKLVSIDLVTGEREVITSGNRNMQGLAVDDNGVAWTVEHGPRGGDKLNRHVKGLNFGWPYRTYGTTYTKKPWPGAVPFGRMDGFSAPVFGWVPSVAVSDITFVRGFNSAWDGDLIVGSLKAQSLFRIRMEGGRAVYSEPIFIGERIRSVHQHTDGMLVVWTDSDKIIKIRSLDGEKAGERVLALIDQHIDNVVVRTKVKAAIETCMQCHSFESNSHEFAPSLGGVFGRGVAATSFGSYGESLKRRGGSWDEQALKSFLRDPQTFAPGTAMPAMPFDEEVLSGIVLALKKSVASRRAH